MTRRPASHMQMSAMDNTRSAKESLSYYIDEADRAAALAVNEATAKAMRAQGGSNSRLGIVIAAEVENALSSHLPSIWRVYTQDAEKLFSSRGSLQDVVRAEICRYYDDLSPRHAPGVHGAFGGSAGGVYFAQIREAKARALAAAEEHFRRPGMRPIWERHARVFGATTFILGLAAERASEAALAWLIG